MPNRNLTKEELTIANALLAELRLKLIALSNGDLTLLFAYRRKLAKELGYDERGKPMQRKMLKARKMGEQAGLCSICSKPLPEKYAVLDRLDGMAGYTPENTRLIHADCDIRVQGERRYQ
jgi:UTP:GlnB (protein PII) uridylyltransferase